MTPAPIGDPGFDAGPAPGGGTAGGAGGEDYENEPPLLEELGGNSTENYEQKRSLKSKFD